MGNQKIYFKSNIQVIKQIQLRKCSKECGRSNQTHFPSRYKLFLIMHWEINCQPWWSVLSYHHPHRRPSHHFTPQYVSVIMAAHIGLIDACPTFLYELSKINIQLIGLINLWSHTEKKQVIITACCRRNGGAMSLFQARLWMKGRVTAYKRLFNCWLITECGIWHF